MIVIGLDVHKQSVTAVAVDEAGRPLAEKVVRVGSDDLLAWAAALDAERLWAVEDCRQLTGWLEKQLLSTGEDLVRVPPKLTVPERRAGRTRGKSDPIDALAIARAAIREPDDLKAIVADGAGRARSERIRRYPDGEAGVTSLPPL